jgi:hypothetical protein
MVGLVFQSYGFSSELLHLRELPLCLELFCELELLSEGFNFTAEFRYVFREFSLYSFEFVEL